MTAPYNEQRFPWSWIYRRRRDSGWLARLRLQDPPDAATGIPVRVVFGPFGLIGVVGYVAVPIISFFILHFVFDFRTELGLFLGVVSVLLELAAALPHFDNLNRAVSVSAEGVRLDKLHRSYAIPWWQMKAIDASPDMNRVRIRGTDAQITFSTTQVSPQAVEGLILTMRAHAMEHGIDIVEMSRRDRLSEYVVPTACHAGAAAILVFGIYQTLPGTLGMRCSVNSEYLQERYGTPDRDGCVVLRVSAGAARAGVKVGDLLIEFEGVPVTSGQQYSAIFDQSSKPWDATVLRSGEPQPLDFTIEGGWGKTFQEAEGDPVFYYLRGRWDAASDPESAIEDYTRAIEVDPNFDLAYLYRGDLMEDRGEFGSGMADIRKALEVSPDLAEAHALYAYHATDPADALKHIVTAIDLSGCQGGFEGLNIDCASEYLALSHLQLHGDPQRGDFGNPSLAAMTAVQSIEFFDGYAYPYIVAACGYSRSERLDEAEDYSAQYLGFPAEERTDHDTTTAEIILSGRGIC